MGLRMDMTLSNSSATECVSLIAEHARQNGDCAEPAGRPDAQNPLRTAGKHLFYLTYEACLRVFRFQRKDIWDAACGIRDMYSALRFVQSALRNKIKDIRIRKSEK